ncbi:MAG: hypothetical protein ACHQ1H_08260, partial [Nitrososphaerales archaeon]
MPFSTRLRMKLEFVMPVYANADLSFEERPNFSERFVKFLIVLQNIMRASVSLMKTAEAECMKSTSNKNRNLNELLE